MGRVKGTPYVGESVVPDGLLDKLSTLRSGQSGASGAGDWWPASPSLHCCVQQQGGDQNYPVVFRHPKD